MSEAASDVEPARALYRGGRSDRGERSERPARAPRRFEGGGETSRTDNSDLEVGTIYRARVVSIKDFGAFVEFMPNREGLVHVSELANARVKRVDDVVQIGDEISVKLIGVDDKGRVRLSRRAAIEDRDRAQGGGSSREVEPHDDGPRD